MKSEPEERANLSRPEEQEELNYQEAAGSGSAAVLAFIHIAAAGIIAYGSYYLLRSSTEAVLASRHLSWQFFFPLGLCLFLYLPTNPLTRVLAACAFWSGIIGLVSVLGAVAMTLSLPSRQVAEITSATMLVTLTLGAVAGLAPAWGLRLLFQRLLPRRDAALD